MMYTSDGASYRSSNRFEKENPNEVPMEKLVWAFAYKIDNETGYKHLSCEPEEGVCSKSYFTPYKKGSHALRKSGQVLKRSRYYADTYAEAVVGYNSLVQDRINRLHEMEDEAKGDMIFTL